MVVDERANEDQIRSQLDSIEADLEELAGTMEILIAMRLVSDGHAANLGEGRRMWQERPAEIMKLYGG